MGWALAVSALVSAGTAAYSASESSKAADEYNQAQLDAQAERDALIAGADESIFGSVPEPVEWPYDPVFENGGYGAIQERTITDNISSAPEAIRLSNLTNKAVTESNQRRIESWLPGFTGNLNTANQQAGSLLAGNVPADVARAIAAQTAGNEASTGTAGTSGADMNRNLGLTSLQNIQSGMSLLGGLTDITGAVDPLSMQMLPQSMFINPSDAIQWQVQETQFDANGQYMADVNNSLLAASADPTAAGKFQLMYANTTPTTQMGADNSAAYAAMASSLSSALKGYTGGTGSTGSAGATGYNYNGAAGYNNGYGTAQGYTGYDNYYSSGQGNLDYAAMAAY